MIATAEYYNGTATGYIDATDTSGITVTYGGGFGNLRLVDSPRFTSNDLYYCRGLAFKTAKIAKAFENMMRSREVSQQLSFFVAKRIIRPPKRVTIRLNAQSVKQRMYNKRKKSKEKLGLTH